MIEIAAGNYTIFFPRHVQSFKFGSTAWTAAQWASTSIALDSSFSTNNATILFNAVGALDANNPVKSAAFAKDIKVTGNERDFPEVPLLGQDSTGAQNQELEEKPVSKLVVTATIVYRNNVPLGLFNDTATAVLMEMDNAEGTTSGIANFGFNNIKILSTGEHTIDSSGHLTQQIKFTCLGGTTGSAINVTQVSPSETWVRYTGKDYAEEVRTA